MKLATLKDGSRDGQLAVVSRDLAQAHFATGIATRMQQLLDDWNFLSPQLEDLYATLNGDKARHAFAFDPRQCLAPLPRAYQWVDASAYLNHLARVRRARGAELPEHARAVPLMYQGGSDPLLGPCDDMRLSDPEAGVDFEAELAVVTSDLPIGATPAQALDAVRLFLLVNDWTLRNLVPDELGRGLGLLQSKPPTAFGPVAVTPDELGDGWAGGRVRLQLLVDLNGRPFGRLDTGADMDFDFGALLAHLARTRPLRAGSVMGGGTVSNADAARGFACIAEKRACELADGGQAVTPWMGRGDAVRIEVKARDGSSLFGAIDQRVSGPDAA